MGMTAGPRGVYQADIHPLFFVPTVELCGRLAYIRDLESCGISDLDVDDGSLQACLTAFGPDNIEHL